MTTLKHTVYLTRRLLRNLMRQPWYIAFMLVQPMIYLLLFSSLFKRVVEIPGFHAHSYITYLTPGIVIMSALFGAGWSGMGVITDLDRGVLDRFLVAPTSRISLILSRLLSMSVTTLIQSAIIIAIAWLVGARFDGGVLGVIILLISGVLLAAPFAALSIGMSLLARKEESVIAAVNFVLLPLTFLSSVFIAQNLMPHWMQVLARFNPVNWAVAAARDAVIGNADWGVVFARLAYLLILAVVCAWLANRSFRTYQRSV